MNARQRSYVRHCRVYGYLLVLAVLAMVALADPNDNEKRVYETLDPRCTAVFSCSPNHLP